MDQLDNCFEDRNIGICALLGADPPAMPVPPVSARWNHYMVQSPALGLCANAHLQLSRL